METYVNDSPVEIDDIVRKISELLDVPGGENDHWGFCLMSP